MAQKGGRAGEMSCIDTSARATEKIPMNSYGSGGFVAITLDA